ncbi:MAG: MBL fold metallo-hydrolase [Coriobacteriia bacterium]|nr:MBL fold metallo-hydrolase [Coriobacteriia bacterium]
MSSRLLFQGHASFRLTSDDGRIVYVDPYKGKGYELPASIILVTHQHTDHNRIKRCAQAPDCRIITNVEALESGTHNSFSIEGILVQAVEAANTRHDPKECVGYIVALDGIKLYFCGDTSMTTQMETLAALELNYAFFPGDGLFNMSPEEAAECARLIGAKHNVLTHLKPGFSYRRAAEAWTAPQKLILEPGDEIEL